MKITLMVHQFFPEWQTGTEVLTRDTAKLLLARNHDVEVWTADPYPHPDGKSYDFFMFEGIPVHKYYHDISVASIGSDLTRAEYENYRFAELFAQHIEKRRPDVVHAFHLFRLTCTALTVARKAGAITVYTPTDFWAVCPAIQLLNSDGQVCTGPIHNSINCAEHLSGVKIPHFVRRLPLKLLQVGTWILEKRSPKYRDSMRRFRSFLNRIWYQRRNLSQIDAILAPTHFIENMFIRNGISRKHMVYQAYGINTDHIGGLSQKNTSGKLRVGYIGTLIHHKGVHVLLQAVKELPPDLPIDVRIYGCETHVPDYVQHLKSLAADDPRISFRGTFPNHEIGDIISDLDVLVVPSIWYENTPLVLASARAAKKPVIATNLGGMSEVISHEHNGLLFPSGDYCELARMILRVAKDAELLNHLAQNIQAPKSMEQYVTELEMIYEHAMRTKIIN
jgi:glycosyltransferase involved in cell wall biosynthesis